MVAGHDYRLATGGGADTVTIASGVPTGTTTSARATLTRIVRRVGYFAPC